MSAKKYIVAVSGGVDSAVLLHKLAAQNSELRAQNVLIVAHFDHGIRADSHEDAAFVRQLAVSYGLQFETERAELGMGAAEASARHARYEFLYACLGKYQAGAIVTAHHQDDVIETILVNILRGTSPRGMIGFSRENIVRPFLDKPKSWILQYATEHNLKWREDSTNSDESYMRNYIRHRLRPRLSDDTVRQLLNAREKVSQNYSEIDDQIRKIIVQIMNTNDIKRSKFVMLPFAVQKELIAAMLRLQGCSFTKHTIEKTVIAIKILPPNKQFDIGQHVTLHANNHTVAIVKNH